MTEILSQLESTAQASGAAAAISQLVESLKSSGDFDAWFDAKLLLVRQEMDLPLVRPSTFDNIPDEKIDAFKDAYIAAARETAELLIEKGDLQRAWMYLRTINEPAPIRAAIEAKDVDFDNADAVEELIHLALYEGAHPVHGLEILLKTHGTCNTVTATDQQLPTMTDEDRRAVAAMLVKTLYQDLQRSVHMDVQQKLAMTPPDTPLSELIAGREWLFEDGNYHIDVSHLNSIVRFARALTSDCPELPLAIELADYGSRLADQFQYHTEAPFDDYYPAHIAYFQVIKDENREAGLKYFQDKLDKEPNVEDQRMIAYVIVDLLLRIKDTDAAVELAAKHLSDLEDPQGFSFSEICHKYNRMDVLQRTAADKNDAVTFLSALLSQSSDK